MIKTIDECFSLIQNGANIKQGDVDGGFPITRIETITNDKFSRDRMGYAGITDISKYTSYLLEDGDLLMSHINSVQYLGRTVLYVKQSDETIIHGMNLLRLKARRDVINPAYAKYCFYGHPFRSQIRKITKKSVNQASFAVKDLKQIKLNIPALSEQNEIVMILDKIQQVLAHRIDELSKLDDLIKARFVEMFGDAVDNPMGWEKKQLQEIVTDDCTISYGIVQTGNDQEEGVPVFRPVDIVNRIPKLEELKRTTEEISNKYKRTILKGHEMLITVRANIADTCIVGKEFKGCNVGRGIVPIRTQENIMVLEFLKYLMDSKHLNDDIKSKAKGITLIQLNMEDLREVELIVPPIEQQKAFVEFAEQVDKSKVKVQKALDETQKLFDSLMQQYFG
ncbi:restriction endonuclease subunit S [Blautia sp.]|uniref:restriction endonuclease subunit S n=1 Tax=Blautia sp. TaxID=1955243 RepID=UPI003AB39EBD